MNGCFFAWGQAAGYTGRTRSLLFAITVAKGCRSCIQAGKEAAFASSNAWIVVATPSDIGNQRTAPVMTYKASRGVRFLHFLNTHPIPLSNARWIACSNAL